MRQQGIWLVAVGVCMLMGGALWWWQQGYVVIYNPSLSVEQSSLLERYRVTKKKIVVTFWYRAAWHEEEREIIWSPDAAQALKQVVNAWLTVLDEEEITDKRVTLQSSVVTVRGTDAYLSFDRGLFDKEGSTRDKLMLLEGLLKTIRESGVQVQQIYFLVHHKPMYDYHLDFSHPWPLQGFL